LEQSTENSLFGFSSSGRDSFVFWFSIFDPGIFIHHQHPAEGTLFPTIGNTFSLCAIYFDLKT
jgi:hypothetical protein